MSSLKKNIEGINNATTQLTKIFENLAQKSCKTVRQRKLKEKKRKKPWSDHEVKDLKCTVIRWGQTLKLQPYNLNIHHNFFRQCKELKRMIKSKKYLFKKAIFDQLLNWKEIDPKQYGNI